MNSKTLIKRLLGLEEAEILTRQIVDNSWDQLLIIRDQRGSCYAYFGDPIKNKWQSLSVRNIKGKLYTFVKNKIKLISDKNFHIEPKQEIQFRNKVIKRALGKYLLNNYFLK